MFDKFLKTFLFIIIGAPFFLLVYYVCSYIGSLFTGLTQFFIYLIPFVFMIGVLYKIFNLEGDDEQQSIQQPPQF